MAPSGVDKGSLQPEHLIVVDEAGEVIHGDGKASAETFLHLTIVATTNASAVLHTHSQAATLLSRFPTFIEAARAPRKPPHGSALTPEGSVHIENQPSKPLTKRESPQPLSSSETAQPAVSEHKERGGLRTSPIAPSLLGYVRLTGLEMLKGIEGIQSHHSSIAIPVLDNSQDIRLLSQAASPHLVQAPYGILIAGHGLYAWGNSLFQARRHLEILEFLLEQHWREVLLISASRATKLFP